MQEMPFELRLWSVLDVFRFYPMSLVTCILWYDIANHKLAIGQMSREEFFVEAQSNLEGIKASGMRHMPVGWMTSPIAPMA